MGESASSRSNSIASFSSSQGPGGLGGLRSDSEASFSKNHVSPPTPSHGTDRLTPPGPTPDSNNENTTIISVGDEADSRQPPNGEASSAQRNKVTGIDWLEKSDGLWRLWKFGECVL